MTAVELATIAGTAENKIACVTLNRPRRLNAIDGSLIDGMDDVLDVLESGEFRAAILTGAGRGFCAGADLSGTGEACTKSSPQSPSFKINYDAQVRLADLHPARELPIPVIAAVNGAGRRRWAGVRAALRHPIALQRPGLVRFHQGGFSSMDMGPATCCRRSSEPGWRES
jgi:enoyl-CoA hydratase/carnithine racemase